VPAKQVHLEDLVTGEDLAYQECPIKIVEMYERATRNKKIWMCKVQWNHHTEEEPTSEREEELKAEFPDFFTESFEFQ
jgi:Na+-translocating ferredoxin:NAD+ oxidoreductase RNF subunit RnfB